MINRINTTINCNDCSCIPKVPNAGQVVKGGYQIMHNGIKVIAGGYHEDWMAKIIKELEGHHEPQEEKAFYEVLKRIPDNGTMIELGSNWAYYSMWFQQAIKNATNIMIEPNEVNLDLGKRNFNSNKMSGVFQNASIGKITVDRPKGLSQICVDDIIKENNLDVVDIIHSDIQGSELNMLYGAVESIEKRKIKYFFISTHGNQVHNNCLDFLKSKQFNIICEHSGPESYSEDGLIVSSRDDKDSIQISKRGA